MINEYELYSDERYQEPQYLLLGGLICTQKRRKMLLQTLGEVRKDFKLEHEMRWSKISKQYIDAYKAWIDVFFDDSYSTFSILKIDRSSKDWKSFKTTANRKPKKDEKLASIFYQFLLISFGKLNDTKRWWVFPDSGFFSKDKVLDRVEFLFNLTYKKAFGPKTSRIIRLASAKDSRKEDLIQLADVLLGAISCEITGYLPLSPARAEMVEYCRNRRLREPVTRRGLEKISIKNWQTLNKFKYEK